MHLVSRLSRLRFGVSPMRAPFIDLYFKKPNFYFEYKFDFVSFSFEQKISVDHAVRTV